MDVAELPGSTAAGKKIHFRKPSKKHTSAQAYLAVPCSSSRLGSGWLQRPRYPASPSIKEAPPTRRRAGRLVRVAYHAACCKMDAPGWTSPWSVVGCISTLPALSLPTEAAGTAGISTRRCRDQICPTRMASPSQQASGFTVGAGLSLLFAARLRTIGVAIHGRLSVHLPYAPSSHRPARCSRYH